MKITSWQNVETFLILSYNILFFFMDMSFGYSTIPLFMDIWKGSSLQLLQVML